MSHMNFLNCCRADAQQLRGTCARRMPSSGQRKDGQLLLYKHLALALVAGLVLLGASGCSLTGQRGPVAKDVLDCRQFSQRGIAAMDAGQWSKAESLFAQASQTCPVDADARRNYAEALWRQGNREAALAQMEQAVQLSGESPEVLLREAELRLELNQLELAQAKAERALGLNPRFAQAWVVRSRIEQQRGRSVEALSDLHRALHLEPSNRQAMLQLAEVNRSLNRPQAALASLQQLLETFADGQQPQQPLVLQALAFEALGRNGDAMDSMNLALRRGPATPDLLCQLARLQWSTGQSALAAQTVQQALTMEPQHSASQQLLQQFQVAGDGVPVRTVMRPHEE